MRSIVWGIDVAILSSRNAPKWEGRLISLLSLIPYSVYFRLNVLFVLISGLFPNIPLWKQQLYHFAPLPFPAPLLSCISLYPITFLFLNTDLAFKLEISLSLLNFKTDFRLVEHSLGWEDSWRKVIEICYYQTELWKVPVHVKGPEVWGHVTSSHYY